MIGAIFSIGKSLVGKLISKGGADVIGSVLKNNTAGTIAEASVKKEEIKADRDVAVEQVKAGNNSWKDEYALGLLSGLFLLINILLFWTTIDAMIDNPSDPEEAIRRFGLLLDVLNKFPEWYVWLFAGAMGAALGIRGFANYKGYGGKK